MHVYFNSPRRFAFVQSLYLFVGRDSRWILLLLLLILVVVMQLRYISKFGYWKVLVHFRVHPLMRWLLRTWEDVVDVLNFRLLWEHLLRGDSTENALSLSWHSRSVLPQNRIASFKIFSSAPGRGRFASNPRPFVFSGPALGKQGFLDQVAYIGISDFDVFVDFVVHHFAADTLPDIGTLMPFSLYLLFTLINAHLQCHHLRFTKIYDDRWSSLFSILLLFLFVISSRNINRLKRHLIHFVILCERVLIRRQIGVQRIVMKRVREHFGRPQAFLLQFNLLVRHFILMVLSGWCFKIHLRCHFDLVMVGHDWSIGLLDQAAHILQAIFISNWLF